MAGKRNKGPVEDAMEQQIEKAQNRVIRTKAAHDTAVYALQKLLDKRDARRKDELERDRKEPKIIRGYHEIHHRRGR